MTHAMPQRPWIFHPVLFNNRDATWPGVGHHLAVTLVRTTAPRQSCCWERQNPPNGGTVMGFVHHHWGNAGVKAGDSSACHAEAVSKAHSVVPLPSIFCGGFWKIPLFWYPFGLPSTDSSLHEPNSAWSEQDKFTQVAFQQTESAAL